MKKIFYLIITTLLITTIFSNVSIAENIEYTIHNHPLNINNQEMLILNNCDDGESVDQQQPSDCGWGQGGWNGVMFAQSFIPTLDSLTRIELRLFKKGNPEGLTISIREELDGEELCSLSVESEEISTSTHWHEFDFEDIPLQPGSTYYITWHQDGSGDSDNVFYWAYGEDDRYQNGKSWILVNNRWNLFDPEYQDDVDFCFKTYGKVKYPSKPLTPLGPEEGDINEEMTYSSSSIDPENKQLYYQWDWGDGDISEWGGPYDSGETISVSHSWIDEDIYIVKVKAKNIDEIESEWSNPIVVGIPVKNEAIDQTQDSNSGHGQGGWSGTQFAQKFIPSQNTLTKIDLFIFKKGDPQGITISIRKELNEEDIITEYSILSDLDEELKAEWITFDFEDIDVISGEPYYIVWEQDGGDSDNVFYWTFGTENPYIYGDAWVNTGSWIKFEPPDYDQPDFCFRSYHAKDQQSNTPFKIFLQNHLRFFPILQLLLELTFL